mmetsp:Transcript_30456/g.50610  ORF Transcript_30456/g.50610 Transcript_30456/m.50610 type:complete len:227 (-) Transcript_30456:1370-2050(-)
MEPSYVTRSTAYKLFPRSWSTLPLPSMFLPCCFLPATTTVYVSILFPSHMTKHSRKQPWSSPHIVLCPRHDSHFNTTCFDNVQSHTFLSTTITHKLTFTVFRTKLHVCSFITFLHQLDFHFQPCPLAIATTATTTTLKMMVHVSLHPSAKSAMTSLQMSWSVAFTSVLKVLDAITPLPPVSSGTTPILLPQAWSSEHVLSLASSWRTTLSSATLAARWSWNRFTES